MNSNSTEINVWNVGTDAAAAAMWQSLVEEENNTYVMWYTEIR